MSDYTIQSAAIVQEALPPSDWKRIEWFMGFTQANWGGYREKPFQPASLDSLAWFLRHNPDFDELEPSFFLGNDGNILAERHDYVYGFALIFAEDTFFYCGPHDHEDTVWPRDGVEDLIEKIHADTTSQETQEAPETAQDMAGRGEARAETAQSAGV